MPSNKERMYVALYATPHPNTYHWALIVAPKVQKGFVGEITRYNVVNRLSNRSGQRQSTWSYETHVLNQSQAEMILVRLLVAKVECSRDKLDTAFRNIQVVQDNAGWTSDIWVRNAIEYVFEQCLVGRGVSDWDIIKNIALVYVDAKKQQGLIRPASVPNNVPTYDLIKDKETAV